MAKKDKENNSSAYDSLVARIVRSANLLTNPVSYIGYDLLNSRLFDRPSEVNRAAYSSVNPEGIGGIAGVLSYLPILGAKYIWGDFNNIWYNTEDKSLPLRTSRAAWAKYNNLPYDESVITDNGDGTFAIPRDLSKRMRTSESEIDASYKINKKNKEALLKKYEDEFDWAVENGKLDEISNISKRKKKDLDLMIYGAAENIDSLNRDAIRTLNERGKAVFNEFNFSGRNLISDDPNKGAVLNVLGNHAMYKDEDGKIKYRDIYDFGFPMDQILNGNTFELKGDAGVKAEGGTVEGEDWTSEDLFNPAYSRESHRKVDQDARDKRFTEELKQQRDDNFENVIVPAVETAIDFSPIIGDLKSAYEAVVETKKGNYALAALASLGVFPGIPGLTKIRRVLSKAGERPIKQLAGPGYSAVGEMVNAVMTPQRVKSMIGWQKAEKNANKSRTFREMFPILPNDVWKAEKASAAAVKEGIDFIDDYYNNPAVKAKVDKLIKENGRNLPPERVKVLKEKGIMDTDGNIDVEKYINANPHLVGDTYALNPQWAGGYHTSIEKGGETVTYDRNFLYRRNPKTLASNAAHEQNHKMQEVLGFDNMSIYDKNTGYYVANPDHSIGGMFSEVANPSTKDAWFKSPSELHSYLIEYKKAKKISPDSVIDGEDFEKLLENGKMKKFFNVTEENKPKIKQLINALPAMIPLGIAMAGDEESYAAGGTVGEMSNQDIAYNYLTGEKGVDPKKAIAIIANLEGESGLNPDITNSIGAYGIQQWLGPRKKELFRRYGDNPTLTDQLDFLLDEHEGKVKGMGWNFVNKGKNLGSDRFNYYMYSRSEFENAPSVADAIIAWNQGFGRPATHELRNDYRLKAGKRLAERYGVDFGHGSYGQMGAEQAKEYVPDWIREPGPKAVNNHIKEEAKRSKESPSIPLGIASYAPVKTEESSPVATTELNPDVKEDIGEEETTYAKKLRARQEELIALRNERKRKMDFFDMVWESINLR